MVKKFRAWFRLFVDGPTTSISMGTWQSLSLHTSILAALGLLGCEHSMIIACTLNL